MDKVGTVCWIRDKLHGWRQGTIASDNGAKLQVRVTPDPTLDIESKTATSQRLVTVKKSDTQIFDDSHNDNSVFDLSELNNFEEAPLLGTVRRRFFQLQVYTYVGEVMIAVNPYKYYEHLVKMPSPLKQYGIGEEPHVRAIASFAFRNIRELHAEVKSTDSDKVNQGIIVSGESGAGKTEACKNVMKYLVALTLEHQEQSGLFCFYLFFLNTSNWSRFLRVLNPVMVRVPYVVHMCRRRGIRTYGRS